MLERVWRIARSVDVNVDVHIATDDDRIEEATLAFGGSCIRTAESCRNGTERVAEAITKIGGTYDVVVNLQGDAPLTPPHFVRSLIAHMGKNKDCDMATPAVRCDAATLSNFQEDRRHGRVGGTTVARTSSGRALYFSKEVIPYIAPGKPPTPIPVFHHVGLYAYRQQLLNEYLSWEPGSLEVLEGLEQLRILENDRHIDVVEVEAGGRPILGD